MLICSNDGERGNGLNRRIRTAVVVVALATTLVAISSEGMAIAVNETTNDKREDTPTGSLLVQADIGWENQQRIDSDTVALPTVKAATLRKSPRKTLKFVKTGTNGSDTVMMPNGDKRPSESLSEHPRYVDTDLIFKSGFDYAPTATGVRPWIKERAADDVTPVQMAQFELPKPSAGGKVPAMELPKRLTYQYGYGSESDITYRRNPDLNKNVPDDYLIMVPELNGHVIYRPTDWLETTLELILEVELPLQEEGRIILPEGEIRLAEGRRASLLIDQAFVTIKDFTDPFRISLGRRNYEDERHWLYDTSVDMASLELKLGNLRAEALVGREAWQDLDLFHMENRDRINTYLLYADYRGIEDIKLAGYAIVRDDRDGQEGQSLLMGVRSQGMRTETFSYWIELANMRGSDESSRDFLGYAFDVGGTYRFLGLPYNPNLTLGYAFATGDDPNDRNNNEFRQNGMQSNEARFAGVADFKYYGEALDPELSNLKILTVDLGFRPAPNVTVDLVYHHYRLDEIAEEIRNAEITALMNQIDTQLSKDVGSAFDIVLGFRNLFDVRRLGIDIRMGWFFPGNAFLRNEGDEDSPIARDADKGFSIVAKFWF